MDALFHFLADHYIVAYVLLFLFFWGLESVALAWRGVWHE